MSFGYPLKSAGPPATPPAPPASFPPPVLGKPLKGGDMESWRWKSGQEGRERNGHASCSSPFTEKRGHENKSWIKTAFETVGNVLPRKTFSGFGNERRFGSGTFDPHSLRSFSGGPWFRGEPPKGWFPLGVPLTQTQLRFRVPKKDTPVSANPKEPGKDDLRGGRGLCQA